MVWDFWSLRPESLHQVAAAEREAVLEGSVTEECLKKKDSAVHDSWHDCVSIKDINTTMPVNYFYWIIQKHLPYCNSTSITVSAVLCHCVQVSFLFSDRGLPDGYRHMNGYGSHTFKLVNANGERVYCKFHYKVRLNPGSVY